MSQAQGSGKTSPPNERPYRQAWESGGDERVTYVADRRQAWRQIGWHGQTGAFFGLAEDPSKHEPGSFGPLWILVDDEPMVEPLAAVRYGPGRTAEVYQDSGGNWCIPNGVWTSVPAATS